ncbi:hypothetical protein [Kitasatospora sp. NRRL B-11411]|uniref:hypothetical protein n=1 Tax=Kitasatospora sp. NRRL B-11411 TaxID=1463822 RepID=UPI0004C31E99|nr:hypothetical protein [Kitasatospora sp. NRRL B-11411]
MADARDLPVEMQAEDCGLAFRVGVQHRLQEPQREVDQASDEEVVAMFRACRTAKDRLVVLLARVRLRRGQATGLHRSDCHLLRSAR